MKGIFLDLATVDQNDLDLSALQATLPQWVMCRETLPEDIAGVIADAQVVITNKVMLDEYILATTPQIALVCVAATGTNNVDLEAATRRHIAVCNVRGYSTASVVEHVFALALALLRRLPQYQQAINDGAWQRSTDFALLDFSIGELSGRTMGIIGAGDLGGAVAGVARAFGMQVLLAERRGAKPRAGRVALEQMLRQADVISIHCPLTPETSGLIGAAELAQMKPNAVLIHTARGGIVDETALLAALEAGTLGGAGVDVLSEEPPRQGNPLLDQRLPNLIVTPHIAWASVEARQRLVDGIVANISGFLAGRPCNVVNRI